MSSVNNMVLSLRDGRTPSPSFTQKHDIFGRQPQRSLTPTPPKPQYKPQPRSLTPTPRSIASAPTTKGEWIVDGDMALYSPSVYNKCRSLFVFDIPPKQLTEHEKRIDAVARSNEFCAVYLHQTADSKSTEKSARAHARQIIDRSYPALRNVIILIYQGINKLRLRPHKYQWARLISVCRRLGIPADTASSIYCGYGVKEARFAYNVGVEFVSFDNWVCGREEKKMIIRNEYLPTMKERENYIIANSELHIQDSEGKIVNVRDIVPSRSFVIVTGDICVKYICKIITAYLKSTHNVVDVSDKIIENSSIKHFNETQVIVMSKFDKCVRPMVTQCNNNKAVIISIHITIPPKFTALFRHILPSELSSDSNDIMKINKEILPRLVTGNYKKYICNLPYIKNDEYMCWF